MTRRGMIPQGDSEKYEFLGENETKIENVTCWSVAQAGSNEEKNEGPKSRWTVPLIINNNLNLNLNGLFYI